MTTETVPTRRYIRELHPSEFVTGTFTISNAQMGRTRQDKPYLKCLISDKSGQMSARMWSINEPTFRSLPTDGFVYLEGETQAYQGELQLIIQVIEPVKPTPDLLRELLPSSERDPNEMFKELAEILDTVEHPQLRAIIRSYLSDTKMMALLHVAPAAKALHHAFLGGLLEHTLQLCKLANIICPLYPKINRELVITGLFLHDLAKMAELRYDAAFNYTDRGELIGHIVDGVVWLHDKVNEINAEGDVTISSEVLMVLQHIIISHHGEPEYGAAKKPATPEAIMVSLLDNLDAKVAMALMAARPDEQAAANLGGDFTARLWQLDTKLYRPDPCAT
ncbi:MAG TPA: HD domain-containing protein [Phycisphaeraceae bacterium]|nr:HD domain-containing protein [Phycisphaeraceae bacterium]